MKHATQARNRLCVNTGTRRLIHSAAAFAHAHNVYSNREFNKTGNRNRHSATCPSKE